MTTKLIGFLKKRNATEIYLKDCKLWSSNIDGLNTKKELLNSTKNLPVLKEFITRFYKIFLNFDKLELLKPYTSEIGTSIIDGYTEDIRYTSLYIISQDETSTMFYILYDLLDNTIILRDSYNKKSWKFPDNVSVFLFISDMYSNRLMDNIVSNIVFYKK